MFFLTYKFVLFMNILYIFDWTQNTILSQFMIQRRDFFWLINVVLTSLQQLSATNLVRYWYWGRPVVRSYTRTPWYSKHPIGRSAGLVGRWFGDFDGRSEEQRGGRQATFHSVFFRNFNANKRKNYSHLIWHAFS